MKVDRRRLIAQDISNRRRHCNNSSKADSNRYRQP
jgi:hypothetical protein